MVIDRRLFVVLLVVVGSLGTPPATAGTGPAATQAGASDGAAPVATPEAAALLARATAWLNFPDSETRMTMDVETGTTPARRYGIRLLKKDSSRLRIEFLEPARERDRKILRVGDKMWMYLPDLGRPIVLSARQSFLGSGFSNADLLRTDLTEDYTAVVLGRETLAGRAALRLELTGKGSQAAYPRVLLWLAEDDAAPLRQEFFTRSGKRIKTLEYAEPKSTASGVRYLARVTVTPDVGRKERTVLLVSELLTGRNLPLSLFQGDSLDQR